jgi:hypothetical protein
MDEANKYIPKNDKEARDFYEQEKELMSRAWQYRRQLAQKAMLTLNNILLSNGLGGGTNEQKENHNKKR